MAATRDAAREPEETWPGRDDSEHLRAAVAAARKQQTPVTIRGSGSKAFLTEAAAQAGASLSTLRHTGIVAYRPDELVVTARGGTSLDELESALRAHGQALPFDPPRFVGGGTVGGAVATGLSGPGRPWLGSVRDAVLGVRVVNGLGPVPRVRRTGAEERCRLRRVTAHDRRFRHARAAPRGEHAGPAGARSRRRSREGLLRGGSRHRRARHPPETPARHGNVPRGRRAADTPRRQRKTASATPATASASISRRRTTRSSTRCAIMRIRSSSNPRPGARSGGCRCPGERRSTSPMPSSNGRARGHGGVPTSIRTWCMARHVTTRDSRCRSAAGHPVRRTPLRSTCAV